MSLLGCHAIVLHSLGHVLIYTYSDYSNDDSNDDDSDDGDSGDDGDRNDDCCGSEYSDDDDYDDDRNNQTDCHVDDSTTQGDSDDDEVVAHPLLHYYSIAHLLPPHNNIQGCSKDEDILYAYYSK